MLPGNTEYGTFSTKKIHACQHRSFGLEKEGVEEKKKQHLEMEQNSFISVWRLPETAMVLVGPERVFFHRGRELTSSGLKHTVCDPLMKFVDRRKTRLNYSVGDSSLTNGCGAVLRE